MIRNQIHVSVTNEKVIKGGHGNYIFVCKIIRFLGETFCLDESVQVIVPDLMVSQVS